MKLPHFSVVAAALWIAPVSAQPQRDYPQEDYVGPLRFCGRAFVIDLASDERITWRGGIDFDIFSMSGPGGELNFYEGNHPDTGGSPQELIETSGPTTLYRLRSKTETSYLMRVDRSPLPMVLHIGGSQLSGADSDLDRLHRIKTAAEDLADCSQPTTEPARRRFIESLARD